MKIENYEEKVYAGVLGKIIVIYLGRPVEPCVDYKKPLSEQGEITH